MGFLPNSQLIMARRPEILRAFQQLGLAINGPSSTITQHGLADGEPGGRLRLLHGAYRSHRLARRHSAGKGGGTLGIRDEPALLRRRARRVIALFGFLNRFNDTMATELESSPIAAGSRRGAGPSASTPADRTPARGPHASERASSTGHPGISPASQRRTASASARSIAVRSAILARISAR
jgi:hypothetical protein